MREGTRLAALDLGSNSFRLEIGEYDGGQLRRIEYLKEPVRQGAGLDADSHLSLDAMQRGWDCLARFAERLAGFERDRVRAVATQTLREARNRDMFLGRAHDILGFPIDVIAGHEEARLIYQGVAHLLPRSTQRRLVIDIGGRSTEMILGKNLDAQCMDSFALGSVAWSMQYFADGRLNARAFARAQLAARAVLEEAVSPFARSQWDLAYGSSGTVSAVADLLHLAGKGDAGVITLPGLQWLAERLMAARHIDRVHLQGLKEDRRPVLAAGLSVLMAIFEALDIGQLQVAQGALRQGVMFDLVRRIQPATDMRALTVRRLMQRFGVDAAQAAHVERTALALFGQLPNAQLSAQQQERVQRKLRWAARLHEIGCHIAHSGYHRHGAYILDHAQAAGFALPELHHLSQLVLGQRGKLGKLGRDPGACPVFAAQLLALRLAVILCHARRAPALAGLKLQRRTQTPLRFVLSCPKNWAAERPQTVYLLQQEAQFWSKTSAAFKLALGK